MIPENTDVDGADVLAYGQRRELCCYMKTNTAEGGNTGIYYRSLPESIVQTFEIEGKGEPTT